MAAPQVFMQGTRTLDELIATARSLSYNENYSYTEGWDDNVAVNIAQLVQDKLYAAITQIDNPANIQEVRLDVFATQYAINLPIDVQMAIRLADVRYLYGTQEWEFITLRQGMIQDRFAYPTNIPDTFAIRNGQILLSPAPNLTKLKSLIINYQKRMRKMDIRRGLVSSINPGTIIQSQQLSKQWVITNVTLGAGVTTITTATGLGFGIGTNFTVGLQSIGGTTNLNGYNYTATVTGAQTFTIPVDTSTSAAYTGGGVALQTPIQFVLNFTANSIKNMNMQDAANSVLDKVYWCCFVDSNGSAIMNAIPLTSYDIGRQVLTAGQDFVPIQTELDALNNAIATNHPVYVVQGDYSSTHSELDRMTESALIEMLVLRFLRLASSSEANTSQLRTEQDVINYLINQYRRNRPTVYPVVWQERLRPRSWPWGRRGMY